METDVHPPLRNDTSFDDKDWCNNDKSDEVAVDEAADNANATATNNVEGANDDDTNNDPPLRDPLPLSTKQGIPLDHIAIIQECCEEIYNISTPRDFQYEAINHCAFNDDTFLAINMALLVANHWFLRERRR